MKDQKFLPETREQTFLVLASQESMFEFLFTIFVPCMCADQSFYVNKRLN